MESFYGGKQGYSFVVKHNPEREDGFFTSLQDIETAIANGNLKYGEYAIITEVGHYTTASGNLYRVDLENHPQLIANVNSPRIYGTLDSIGSYDSNYHFGQVNFLDQNASKQATDLKMSIIAVEDGNNNLVGYQLGIAAPHPVIEYEIESSDEYIPTVNVNTIAPFFNKITQKETLKVDVQSQAFIDSLEEEDVYNGVVIFKFNYTDDIGVSTMFENLLTTATSPVTISYNGGTVTCIRIITDTPLNISKAKGFKIIGNSQDAINAINNSYLTFNANVQSVDSDEWIPLIGGNPKEIQLNHFYKINAEDVAFLQFTFYYSANEPNAGSQLKNTLSDLSIVLIE